jgi:RNA polymerase sigma-70 factor (family 1)
VSVSSHSPYDERAVLIRTSKGDESAFRQLFDRHRDRIYGFAFYLTREEAVAEEITQDVFTKVWLNREDLATVDYFISWIRVIARNQAYNYLSHSARERLMLRELASRADETDLSTEKMLEAREFGRLLEQAVEKLPPQQQKVWRLSRQAGLKIDEIADQLEISPYTVKNHLKEALRQVRANLDGHLHALIAIGIALFFRD